MPRREEPQISDAILDQLPAGAYPKTAFDPTPQPVDDGDEDIARASCCLRSTLALAV